jgi:hypothetical protein
MKNATQDANKSFDQKLIDIISQQNDIIFSTRKRLFKLERTQNRDAKFSCFMSIGICVICILMCLQFGGFTW